MEKEERHFLYQPLLSLPTPSSYEINQHTNYNTINNSNFFISNNNIILRILLVLFVALISIWANYEASKTFEIYILNDTKDSLAGRRFTLFYISNDKATRILLNTSSFVEQILYPNSNNNNNIQNKKNIKSVTLHLTDKNLNTTIVTVVKRNIKDYIIDISPMLFEDKNFNKMEIVGEIQRAMARVWLWDGRSKAPPRLLDGMAEYVAELAGFRREIFSGGFGESPECEVGRDLWWEDKDPTHVARLLHYCENFKKGFIQRLNEAMRDTWHDRMVDDLLGLEATTCRLHNASYPKKTHFFGI
ncbi:uncharacterized protein [Cicer arietinum]|uniref:Uncharacterized protein LOC101512522 n=1 Tax=Cicer arietinum TaxID=3827 RepID=A0A1S2Z8F8_CICAR|nr:uncharacterized protein LOC101512522 [Cicer arietinum]